MTTTEITPADLQRMTTTTGIGRDILESRIRTLAEEVDDLRRVNATLARNLTNVQVRCTQLLFENRSLRLTGSEETRFLVAVHDQLQVARAKYPGNTLRLAAIVEEAGECARALNKNEGPERVYAECVDLAVTALRLALEGDAAFAKEGRAT